VDGIVTTDLTFSCAGEGRIEFQTPRFRVRESLGDSSSRTLIDVSNDGITADMESVTVPMGGFAVQQAFHAPVILGMPHQDLRQVQ
jgi:hypothetical protein